MKMKLIQLTRVTSTLTQCRPSVNVSPLMQLLSKLKCKGPPFFCGLFYDSVNSCNEERRLIGSQMNDELKRFVNKQPWPNQGTIPIFNSRDWGKPWTSSAKAPRVPVEITTEHASYTSIESYRYVNPFGLNKLIKYHFLFSFHETFLWN
jgi:hypothetical protein